MNPIKVEPILDDVKRPLWSVMIPTYNCAVFLKETIESVLVQDRGEEDMEIWVVDDCSSDDPGEVIQQFGKGRVKLYRQTKNVGQLNNFSTCLNLARGKLIHMLHGDDFVHNGFYKSLEVPVLADTTIGAAFTRHNIVDERGDLMFPSEQLFLRPGVIKDFMPLIATKQRIQTPSIIVKREVYERLGGFDKDLTYLEDWEMWIRIAAKYKFYYEPTILASYRVRGGSNTNNSFKTTRFITDFLQFLKTLPDYLDMTEYEKANIIKKAKQNFLDYTLKSGKEKNSYAIIRRSYPLIYNSSSLYQFLEEIVKYPLRKLLRKNR